MSVRLTRERSWVRAPLLPLINPLGYIDVDVWAGFFFCRRISCLKAVFPSYFLSQCPNFFVRNITLHYDYLTSIEFRPKLWYIDFSQRGRGPVLAPIRADQTGPAPFYRPPDNRTRHVLLTISLFYVFPCHGFPPDHLLLKFPSLSADTSRLFPIILIFA